jgi:histidyl-tRNA synthetase
VELGYEPAKLKKAMGVANKLQARYAIIIGENEVASGRYQVKEMATGKQETIDPESIFSFLLLAENRRGEICSESE